MKTKNIFLTISLLAFAIGFSSVGESIYWDMCLPVGAIFFMLFMIFNLLEKEAALLDQQNRDAAANRNPANLKKFSPGLEKGTKPVCAARTLENQIAI